MLARLAITLLAALCSCQAPLYLQKSPVYDAAFAMAKDAKPFSPLLLVKAPTSSPGELVPYANLTQMLEIGPDRRPIWLWRKSVEHRPDVVVYSEGDPVMTGASSFYLGWGVSSVVPHYARQGWVTLLRAPNYVLPFVTEDRMILSIRDGSDAKAAGLLEGDSVVAIDGAAVQPGSIDSPHYAAVLAMTGERKIRVSVIRPGTGKVDVEVTPVANPRTFSSLANARDLKEFKVEEPKNGRWRAVSRYGS